MSLDLAATTGRPREADAAGDLADALARCIERFSLGRQPDEVVARFASAAARALSLASSEGHACLRLHDLAEVAPQGGAAPPGAAGWRALLLRSGVVGTPEQPASMPMILDVDGRLYLHRDHDLEVRLARRLVRAARQPPAPIPAAARRWLHAATGSPGTAAAAAAGAVDAQRLAVALALRQRLVVVSGGPGTGKTTTVVRLLAALLETDPACRIALAAPTGKAAARLAEAIRDRSAELPAELASRLPRQASTVHRLLGAGRAGAATAAGEGGDGVAARARAFAHHAGRPLPIDVLVVDEASMLDLALATHLLEAVPEAARIVLLGDKDQLAAVESGAVFADLSAQRAWSAPARQALAEACGVAVAALAGVAPEVAAPEEGAEAHADAVGSASPAAGAALADAVVWLTHSHRFAADSPIGLLAREVAAGRSDDAIARLRGSDGSVLRWIEGGDDTAAGEILDPSPAEAMRRGLDDYLQALRRDPADHAAVFEAFGRTRVLCAVREGPRGVRAVNDALQRDLRRALREVPHAASGDLGRPILVLRNDEALGLFNGDLGLVLPGPGVAQAVVFPDGAGGFRAVPAARLPEHETAFAMTVHKAQGSEFDHAIVLLPGRRSRVVTRELLYTAITRARRSVTVVGSAVVVAAAIATPTRREGGLAARLREAATAAGGAG